MKILVICGDHYRNLYLIKAIAKTKLVKNLRIIILRRENVFQSPPKNLTKIQKKYWNIHFKKRVSVENKFFKFDLNKYANIYGKDSITYISKIEDLKKLNNDFKFKRNFEQCYISGLPILNKLLMSILPVYTINLHLGLIPYYKGALPSIWPSFFFKPHYTGTTYHVIGKFVDTGEIIHQNLAKLKKEYGLHELISSVNKSAFNDISLVLKKINTRVKNKVKPNRDNSLIRRGKTFRREDFDPEIYNIIYDKYKDKIVKHFLRYNKNFKKPKIISIK